MQRKNKPTYRRKRSLARRGKRSFKKAKVSSSVKTYVRRTLSRSAETKMVTYTSGGNTFGNPVSGTPAGTDLRPDIRQGTEHDQRIGNSVRIVSAHARIHVRSLAYNSVTNPHHNPMVLKVWLVSSKKYNGPNLSESGISSNFFEYNGASGTSGTILDLGFEVNKEAWTVHKSWQRTIRVWDTTGDLNLNRSCDISFNFAKYLKTLEFSSDTAIYTTNKNLWLIYRCYYTGGHASPTEGMERYVTLSYKFKDL